MDEKQSFTIAMRQLLQALEDCACQKIASTFTSIGIFKLSPSFVVGLSQRIVGPVKMLNLSINMI
jgi:hypothetical protein